jgi:large subunit ribosomal protein L3
MGSLMAKIREKGLVAKKVGMTRMVDANGDVIPVTLVQIPDQKITKVLTVERDGYQGYQVGYFIKAEKNLNKSDIGRLRKIDLTENFARFSEFRSPSDSPFQVGQALTAEVLKDVTSIDVMGVTKGRGFQGSVKRWNSAIGPMAHGSMYHRRTGSLGSNTTPGRVFKNKHMPGHMGVAQRTVRNLEIVDLDVENNIVAIKGSIPGHRDGYLEIRVVEGTNKKKSAS